jgi:hypothetical protein
MKYSQKISLHIIYIDMIESSIWIIHHHFTTCKPFLCTSLHEERDMHISCHEFFCPSPCPFIHSFTAKFISVSVLNLCPPRRCFICFQSWRSNIWETNLTMMWKHQWNSDLKNRTLTCMSRGLIPWHDKNLILDEECEKKIVYKLYYDVLSITKIQKVTWRHMSFQLTFSLNQIYTINYPWLFINSKVLDLIVNLPQSFLIVFISYDHFQDDIFCLKYFSSSCKWGRNGLLFKSLLSKISRV